MIYLLERPLNIAVTSKNWKNYAPSRTRTYSFTRSESNYESLDHTVLLVGYTEKEWIVKN